MDAYNADAGTDLDRLELVSANNPHWADQTYQSPIFAPGEPDEIGTVGEDPQDLLLDPSTNFTPTIRRFELTNVDAAALVDIGWSILETTANPLDFNGDGRVDAFDLDESCAGGLDPEPFLANLGAIIADVNFDGSVSVRDFLVISRNFNQPGTYSDGDLTCNGVVEVRDFLILSREFGSSAARAQSVPEPGAPIGWLLVVSGLIGLRRRHR